jgi:hypothetical protein
MFLILVFPVSLILIQESLVRQDRKATLAATGGALASVIAAFALLRNNTLVIDRGAGTVISSRFRSFLGAQKTFPLSYVKSVRLRMRVVEHSLPPGGRGPEWIENVYRIFLEVDQTDVPFHDGISGPIGKNLATRLAEDLGVCVRKVS